MWQYKSTDELYHYGVKGMKWGRRRKYSLLPSQGVQTYGRVPVTSPAGKSDAYAGRTPNQIQRIPNRPAGARPKTVGGISNGVSTGKKLTAKEHRRGHSTVGDDHDAYNKYHPVLGDTAEANSRAEKKSAELAKERIEKLLKKKKDKNKRKAEKIYLNNLK